MALLILLVAALLIVAATVTILAVPIDRAAYIAVGAVLLLITWNGLRVAGGGIANVFVVIALGAVFARAVLERRAPPLPPWLAAAAGGFVLAAMLNLIFPPHPELLDKSLISFRTAFTGQELNYLIPRSDLLTLVQFLVAFVAIPVMIAATATSKTRIERLIDLFVLSAVVNAFVGIVDWAGLHIAPTDAALSGRGAGLTIHPNYLALTCTVAIPLALLWISRGGRWRSAGLVATALLLGGVYVSGSRAGTVSALLAVVVTVAALPRLRGALGMVLPAVGLLLIPLLAFTNAGRQILEQVRLSGVNNSGSNNARDTVAEVAKAQFSARPLQGIGMGVIQDAHNIYLQLLAAAGLIGMASFLTFVAGVWSSMRRTLGGPLRDLSVACGISVLMWLINGAVDSQLADKYLYVVPGLLIAAAGLATARSPASERQHPQPDQRVPPRPSLA
jgi:hypothetical protein